jgi:hypothetical protein
LRFPAADGGNAITELDHQHCDRPGLDDRLAREALPSGQLSYDRNQRVGEGGADDHIGEADLLPSPLDFLGGGAGSGFGVHL